jgi:hypothetical protein
MPIGRRGKAQSFENLPAASVDQAGYERRKKCAQVSDRPASRKECAQVSKQILPTSPQTRQALRDCAVFS